MSLLNYFSNRIYPYKDQHDTFIARGLHLNMLVDGINTNYDAIQNIVPGTVVDFGAATQIPYVQTDGTNFDYNSYFTYNPAIRELLLDDSGGQGPQVRLRNSGGTQMTMSIRATGGVGAYGRIDVGNNLLQLYTNDGVQQVTNMSTDSGVGYLMDFDITSQTGTNTFEGLVIDVNAVARPSSGLKKAIQIVHNAGESLSIHADGSIRAPSGGKVDFGVATGLYWSISDFSVGRVGGTGGALYNREPANANATVVPNLASNTTGMGGTGGDVSLVCGSSLRVLGASGGTTYLYYSASAKLATYTGGIQITGNIYASAITAVAQQKALLYNSASGIITYADGAGNVNAFLNGAGAFTVPPASAWTAATGGIEYTGGFVGIGTSGTVNLPFEVHGDLTNFAASIANVNTTGNGLYVSARSGAAYMFAVNDSTLNDVLFAVTGSGTVWIGNDVTATSIFEVSKDFGGILSILSNNNTGTNAEGLYIETYNPGAGTPGKYILRVRNNAANVFSVETTGEIETYTTVVASGTDAQVRILSNLNGRQGLIVKNSDTTGNAVIAQVVIAAGSGSTSGDPQLQLYAYGENFAGTYESTGILNSGVALMYSGYQSKNLIIQAGKFGTSTPDLAVGNIHFMTNTILRTTINVFGQLVHTTDYAANYAMSISNTNADPRGLYINLPNSTSIADIVFACNSATSTSVGLFSVDADGTVFQGIMKNATIVAQHHQMYWDDVNNWYLRASSDERLKQNIVSFDKDALAVLSSFSPKQFEPKDNPGVTATGWIAQEGVEHIPDMFPLDKKTDLYGINDGKILPYYHKAIMQLLARIEELENK